MINIENYRNLVNSKRFVDVNAGFDVDESWLNPYLKDFQKVCVKWALKRGRAALFEDTGLGKTIQFLSWARCVCDYTSGKVLVLSPLCVAHQTVKEAEKFGIKGVSYSRGVINTESDIIVTNYEMIDKFDISQFVGVVLDEGSIIKNESGKTKELIVNSFRNTPYRLTCTATPSPNDFMELGTQSEFLGVMTMSEMLAMFFVNDSKENVKWRLKGHGVDKFWEWLATWAIVIKKPSDLGFSDEGYILPKLNIIEHVVDFASSVEDGKLFSMLAQSLNEVRREKRESIQDRADAIAQLVNASDEQWVVWCDLNDESKALCSRIDQSLEVEGSQSVDVKEHIINNFNSGKLKVLVTKPKIAGFGSNWQHTHNMVHSSINYSWEMFYQTIRRQWRFGQVKEVNVHVFRTANESYVWKVMQDKQKKNEEMSIRMISKMKNIMIEKINSLEKEEMTYESDVYKADRFTLYKGDCVEVMHKDINDNSIDYSIFSPPFSSLYTFSNSAFDMSNTNDDKMFMDQLKYCADELYRITKPGRLLSFHCINLTTTKHRDGVIGLRDFRGELIKMFCDSGFIYHSEVTIWKDPVVAMQRTKALGLLWKQIKKDSSMCRQGLADYLVTMRKPGDNVCAISHTEDEFPVDLWSRYASPVWFDVDQGDTLNRSEARENEDERHISALQLGVIRRALKLWTNPNDVVFTPFLGIGSEVFIALQEGRRGMGIELKPKYFDVAVRNCESATRQMSLPGM